MQSVWLQPFSYACQVMILSFQDPCMLYTWSLVKSHHGIGSPCSNYGTCFQDAGVGLLHVEGNPYVASVPKKCFALVIVPHLPYIFIMMLQTKRSYTKPFVFAITCNVHPMSKVLLLLIFHQLACFFLLCNDGTCLEHNNKCQMVWSHLPSPKFCRSMLTP